MNTEKTSKNIFTFYEGLIFFPRPGIEMGRDNINY